MANPPPRANCFDASALVKIYVNEPGSAVIREYFFARSPTKYTTPFCFYEALTVLKVKWMYRSELSRAQYLDASFRLMAWYQASTKHTRDVNFHDPSTFLRVRALAEKHSIDLSDAFQILSVKEGFFSVLVNDSQTILVTADEALAMAARAEGVKSWYCLGEPEP